MEELLSAWSKIATLLRLSDEEIINGNTWLTTFFWGELKHAAYKNQGGFKVSRLGDLSISALKELRYITENFYISRIDKACNNIAVIFIKHIKNGTTTFAWRGL